MSSKLYYLFFAIGLAASLVVSASEFSEPRDFSDFESNLGSQQLIEVAVRWVGAKPQEIAPGSIPLGALKGKKYILSSGEGEFVNEQSKAVLPQPLPTVELSTGVEEINQPLPTVQLDPVPEEVKPVERKRGSKKAGNWVGMRPHELAPRVIDANLFNQQQEKMALQYSNDSPVAQNRTIPAEVPPTDTEGAKETKPLSMSIFLSSRPYYSHNVLRLKNANDGALVWENTMGASLSVMPLKMGDYLTMVPRIDLMMQTASYQDKEVGGTSLKETLGYRFGLVKMGLGLELPQDYSLSLGYEYNLISSLDTGKKMSDAYAPSLRLGKMFSLNESTLLSFDVSSRLSSTDTIKPLATLPSNDGDNFQLGWNFSLIKVFGEQGQFMIMPNLGVSRTEYLKHDKDGTVSRTITAGITGSWRVFEWLSWDAGINYTLYRSTDDLTVNPGAQYEAVDFGTTLMASYLF